MADFYAVQQVGVIDGTVIPPLKADGREVGASRRSTLASKLAGQAWANGDRIFLGKKRANEKLVGIRLTTDTSLSTTTIDIGIAGATNKYAGGKTLTVVDTPTMIGPKSATIYGLTGTEETLFATLGVGGVGAAVLLTFELEFVGIDP